MQRYLVGGAVRDKLLDKADAWRRPERIKQLLIACEAIARSRQWCQSPNYPPKDFLLTALSQCKQIDTKALLKQGFKGLALKEKLQQERAAIVRRLKHSSYET